ncbi:succinate dehydrogenase [ubiquinone] cytochrome b small subunit B, mitochondrial-like [Tubulanus polymorphus]|uniref:succinate dehydrogenase [ubiquinone] cytochrome b small subunit B, mitochondrial-like n=1 Tax=Tubulanus polymorphus TaxID=672921 RepID=UPI003DA4C903
MNGLVFRLGSRGFGLTTGTAGLFRPKFSSVTSRPALPLVTVVAGTAESSQQRRIHTTNVFLSKKEKSRFSDPMVWGDPAKQHLRPSVHWKVERYLATALIPLIPASFIYVHPAMDYILAAGLVLHAYWGLDTVAVDYIHRKVLPPAVCEWMILIFAALGFAGICVFNYNDIGCIGAVKYFWALDKKNKTPAIEQ